jgi:hypothetical protein
VVDDAELDELTSRLDDSLEELERELTTEASTAMR